MTLTRDEELSAVTLVLDARLHSFDVDIPLLADEIIESLKLANSAAPSHEPRTTESHPDLPSFIDRKWLDAMHPTAYTLPPDPSMTEADRAKWAALTGGKSADTFNRCPTCEEWSPCRVRTLFEVCEARSSHSDLDVERLARAMNILDSDEPGIFNIVAISEPDTRPVAAKLAAWYDALEIEARSSHSDVSADLRAALMDLRATLYEQIGPPEDLSKRDDLGERAKAQIIMWDACLRYVIYQIDGLLALAAPKETL